MLSQNQFFVKVLVADMKVHGVWDRERPAFFDTRVVNADAVSYTSMDWPTISRHAAQAKHAKYDRIAEDLRGSFTPLVISCNGALHKEYDTSLKNASLRLASKWSKSYAQVMMWTRVKTQFSVHRAVSMRLRGPRKQVRGLGLEDGAAIWLPQD